VPTESKAYLHRVGRTAARGEGTAITLMTTTSPAVRRFESELGIVMHRVRLREGHVIASTPRSGAPITNRT